MIKLIKLITGEEIICEIVSNPESHRSGVIWVTNPLLADNYHGGELVPWSNKITPGIMIPINYDSVIFEADVTFAITKAYTDALKNGPAQREYLKEG